LDEAESWCRKSLKITEALSNRPGMAITYHCLGMVARDRGELGEAESWHRKSLEITEALNDRPGMERTYHQLGIVAQLRGELDEAESWYRKSLEIEEALNLRLRMAITYSALETLDEVRKQPQLALAWDIRCLALFQDIPHPGTGDGPARLVALTAQLGMEALESCWVNVTGNTLPSAVRAFVVAAKEND
jgi:tetratricopeptide (TPR) repeat protein